MENDINQIKNRIKEEFEKGYPRTSKILSYLTSLRIYEKGLEFDPKDEWRYLPDTEFFDIVGETFKLNPKFYMKNLYKDVRKKLSKDIKNMLKNRGISLRDLREDFKEKGFGFIASLGKMDKYILARLGKMDKYIFEKYCLHDGEQILLESGGVIQYGRARASGALYVTNNRIIAQGGVVAAGSHLVNPGFSDRFRIINFSRQQKCYGYVFPIKNLYRLRKRKRGVTYKAKLNYTTRRVRIGMGKFPKREEHLSKIFEILSKHSKEEVRYKNNIIKQ